jgi:predicted nucleic acid-binding protein
MALRKDIAGRRIYLDTNIIVYAVEEPVPLTRGQAALFDAIDNGSVHAFTSELALAECLVHPFAVNDSSLASAYETFLGGETELKLVPLDRHILIAAAHIRALTKMKLPDAIHVASAMSMGAAIFLTADRRIKGPPEMRIEKWGGL